jgi:hypothetical protein
MKVCGQRQARVATHMSSHQNSNTRLTGGGGGVGGGRGDELCYQPEFAAQISLKYFDETFFIWE